MKRLTLIALLAPVAGLTGIYIVGTNTCYLADLEVLDPETAIQVAFQEVKKSGWGKNLRYPSLEALRSANPECCKVTSHTATPGPGWYVTLTEPPEKPFYNFHVRFNRCGQAVSVDEYSNN